jgi:hypothetical protein
MGLPLPRVQVPKRKTRRRLAATTKKEWEVTDKTWWWWRRARRDDDGRRMPWELREIKGAPCVRGMPGVIGKSRSDGIYRLQEK